MGGITAVMIATWLGILFAGPEAVAGAAAVSVYMEVSLDQSEREELEPFRAARTAAAAGDADKAKRLMESSGRARV